MKEIQPFLATSRVTEPRPLLMYVVIRCSRSEEQNVWMKQTCPV